MNCMGSVNACHVLDGGLSDVSTAIFTKWYNRLCTQLKMHDFKCAFKNTGKPDRLLDKKSSMMPGHHFGLEASVIVSRTPSSYIANPLETISINPCTRMRLRCFGRIAVFLTSPQNKKIITIQLKTIISFYIFDNCMKSEVIQHFQSILSKTAS